ncbi:ATP-binding protein [uncultured Sphingomonas sp.]|uniref:sensor histidine kinase n=1 Tax=uncultured Sphingomonas sp. TaxID=158754 RepID=UPI00260A2C6E|nr:ATP-binding protein [uncultured Sphingomonas sp.]
MGLFSAKSIRIRVALAAGLVAALTLVVALGLRAYAYGHALDNLRRDVGRVARQQERLLSSELQRFRLLPIVLGEYPDLRSALIAGPGRAADRMNEKLALLAERTGAPVIYVINPQGRTIAASNARKPDSFVGRDYAFRPYFRRAMANGTAEYFALGNVSHRPGLFLARRLGPVDAPVGVVVVKVEFDGMARAWTTDLGQTLLVDAHGVVVVATDPPARFSTLRPLSPGERAEIRETRQFGALPLPLSGYRLGGDGNGRDRLGDKVVARAVPAPLPGWRLIHVAPVASALREADAWVRAATVLVGVALALLAAGWLWRQTRAERQMAARVALEAEVTRRTAELREANGRLTVEIGERIRADQRFRAAREELAQANRLGSLGSITASVAHEINQPVAAIRTLADNARIFLEREAPERAGQNLLSIVELTQRIGSIVQEMRRFAKRGTHGIGPVAIAEIIEGTMLLIGDRFRSAGVALDRPPVGDALPMVMAGRVRLEQVLVNLLQNALDAVAGQSAPEVALYVEDDGGDTVAIVVADNGSGLDPALAPVIFTPFVTGKPDGLGLGLGIARDIMTEFGGMLETVPSRLGGAAFRVTLRRA